MALPVDGHLTESYENGAFNVCRVQISKASDSSWTTLTQWDSRLPNVESWTKIAIDLSSYSGSVVKIRFNFDTIDYLYNDYEGWYIDDIRITLNFDCINISDIIFMTGDSPNTIAKLLPIMKSGGINPVIIYEPNMENEIFYFLSQFSQTQKQIVTISSTPTYKFMLSKVEDENEDLDVGALSAPFITDWNDDGKKDLVIGNKNGDVYLYLNNATKAKPKFTTGNKLPGVKVSSYSGAAIPCVVDWDNDGKKDLIVACAENRFGEIYLYLNEGSNSEPAFATETKIYKELYFECLSKVTVAGATYHYSPFIARVVDWNNDGEWGLIIGSNDGCIYSYERSWVSIPSAFVEQLKKQFPNSTVHNISIDKFHEYYWPSLNQAKAPKQLVVIDGKTDSEVTDFTPYGIQYASLGHCPIANTKSEVQWFIKNQPSITSVKYFGDNASLQSYLRDTYTDKSIEVLSNIDEAEKEIVTSYQVNQTVTVIPSISMDPFSYWKPAVIYSVSRETMLITARGSNHSEIDTNIEKDLTSNIKPRNDDKYPIWMSIFGSQEVIPILVNIVKEYGLSGLSAFSSAGELLYADIDEDFYLDLAVGRIAHGMNNLAIVSMFAGRGIFFKNLSHSTKAQEDNLLKDIAGSEIIITSGHRYPILLTTSLWPRPYWEAEIIATDFTAHKLNFAPSFWAISACSPTSLTNEHYYFLSLLPRLGIVNLWAAVDVAGGSNTIEILEKIGTGATIGEAGKYAYQSSKNPKRMNLPAMYTLYGDPLVIYSSSYNIPDDYTPPTIQEKSMTVTKPNKNVIRIEVEITDNIALKHVELWYRQDNATPPDLYKYCDKDGKLNGRAYYAIPMTKDGDTNKYKVDFEIWLLTKLNFNHTKPIEYLVRAHDINNTATTSVYEFTISGV
ncbi:MAG: FG-GAP-like repeat-containing protein [Candidatus Thermoplasmatota archaeon]